MEEEYCDVCGTESELEMISSGLGPVSGLKCRACIEMNAEPLWVVFAWLHSYGGPQISPEYLKEVVSYHEGGYIKSAMIAKLYGQLEPEIVSEFDVDTKGYELFDDPNDKPG